MSKQFVVLVNPKTKQTVLIDNFKVRLNRMKRRIRSWAEVMKNETEYRMYMYTLTYRPGVEWEPGHIRHFMRSLQHHYGSGLLAYAWVAELQERGAVHYHVIIMLAPKVRALLADRSGWWKWGRTGLGLAKSPWYLVKYVGKEFQKDFSKYPKGIRVFSVWCSDAQLSKSLRYLTLTMFQRMAVDCDGWENLKAWVAIRKKQSGWYADGFYGEWYQADKKVGEWEDFWLEHKDEDLVPVLKEYESGRRVYKVKS